MPAQRPIGFSPAEISALLNKEVVAQHADEAAFLWTLRNGATSEPHFELKDLVALDERVEAHLDGLRCAGEPAWNSCEAGAAAGNAGGVFAAAVLAFGAGQRDWMRQALHMAVKSSSTPAELVSALGWLEFGRVSEWIRVLLEARLPVHRAIAVAAYAVHRQDPGAALGPAIDDDDPQLRRRALRAVGQIKRHDLLKSVREHFHDRDDVCRFWAAWSAVLLGVREGIPLLVEAAERDETYCDRAMQLALRAMRPDESRGWISVLAQQPGRARTAVVGAGIIGDPVSVPWLITKMEVPELAKVAGEAFCAITGADLGFDDLEMEAVPVAGETAIDEVLGLDYESNLRVPDPRLVSAWWEKRQRSFSPGQRYLAGKRVDREGMVDVLISGKQRQRAGAALEFAMIDLDRPVFEVRAPGWRQRQQLTSWTS